MSRRKRLPVSKKVDQTPSYYRNSPGRSLLAYTRALLPSLNPTERLVGEYILEDPERMLFSPISAVRQGSRASVGSIVTFCRRLGVRGFAEFKIALAREMAYGGLSNSNETVSEPSELSVFEQVFYFHTQNLTDTLRINSSGTLLQASQFLQKARKIELFSTGLSYPIAYTAYCKFRLIGLPVSVAQEGHMQIVAATQLRKGDAAFGISLSGRTRETVQCLEIARENKATTLCLTNSIKSPITTHADLALYATPGEIKYFQAPLASRVTQLALVDALFVSIVIRDKNRVMRQIQKAAERLEDHRIR